MNPNTVPEVSIYGSQGAKSYAHEDDTRPLAPEKQHSNRTTKARWMLAACSLLLFFFSAGAAAGAWIESSKCASELAECGKPSCDASKPIIKCMPMPPPRREPRLGANGLIFVGLSLSRYSLDLAKTSHNASVSRQTEFDFNLLQDREYKHVAGTNDDGWLVGGGEGDGSTPGSEASWKLANADSAHVEVVHVGNGNVAHGGLTEAMIIEKMRNVTFKPIKVKPSELVLNDDEPPELELRFASEENQELVQLQDRLKQVFDNPSSTFPDKFHMSIARKVHFYSSEDRAQFLSKGRAAVEEWRRLHPDGVVLRPDADAIREGLVTKDEADSPGGVYLFWGRNEVRHYFPPSTSGEFP